MSQNEKNALIHDLVNSYRFIDDKNFKNEIDNDLNCVLQKLQKRIDSGNPINVWVDGSYNQNTKKKDKAGISFVIDKNPELGIDREIIYGRSLENSKCHDSLEAEVWAIAIALSYIVDTFENVKNIHVHYDCINILTCAANIEAYVNYGEPYTNYNKALKRAKKKNINILFEHVKAHRGNFGNELCDIIAKYYSHASLSAKDRATVQSLSDKFKIVTAPVKNKKK